MPRFLQNLLMSAKTPIGVFDSGLGGLTILKAVRRRLPQYDYVYLGDTARAPYGGRSAEEILAYAKQAVDFLFAEGCELILFACNTVSAEALRTIQQTYLHEKYGPEKRVLGVIVPTLEYVVADPSHQNIGVIATEATVRSETFPTELKKIAPERNIFQQAAPLLVPLVEAGEHKTGAADAALKQYIEPLLEKGIDTLILGCTHYEHMLPQIERIAGGAVKVVCESEIVSEKLAEYLSRHANLETKLSREGSAVFYTTDATPRFSEETKLFFGEEIEARRATLG